MPGFTHIFHLGSEPREHGRKVGQYQLNYTVGGNTYVRVFDEDSLDVFLRTELGLTPEITDRAMRDLRQGGRTTIADVEIPAHEAPALGLEQVPSDY